MLTIAYFRMTMATAATDSRWGFIDAYKQNNGSFEISIDEAGAISIDNGEQAALRTYYEAIRYAQTEHLSEA